MTQDEAVQWLEQQGMRVRIFGESIDVAFGDPVDTGYGIRVCPWGATIHPSERDAGWVILDHGVSVGRFDDLASAVHAVHLYLVDRAAAPRRVALVRAAAVRWVSDEPQPGCVEVQLVLADGSVVSLLDKAPIFDAEDRLRPDASYPLELELDCTVIDDRGAVLVIMLHHGLADEPFHVNAASVRRRGREASKDP